MLYYLLAAALVVVDQLVKFLVRANIPLGEGVPFIPFAMVSLALVLAGAVGNLIDRLFLGYVTDMFQTLFMNFPIFNVADICIVCGGIAFCVYFLLFCKEEEKA